MVRAIILCLILFLSVSDASARLLDQELSQKLVLADLLEIKTSRYAAGCSYSRFPKSEKRIRILPDHTRDPLERVYAPAHARSYRVQPNDTLAKIARKFATTVELIKALNRIKSDHLKVGQQLLVSDQVFSVEINKTFNRLYLRAGDILIKEYPVSTGKSAELTPVGVFFIQSRYPFPTWFHKGVIVSAASPENFLGSRWLGFDKPQFGMHGTIFPELIGQSVSKGCIRMKNEDVEELYEFIPVGTMVVITEI